MFLEALSSSSGKDCADGSWTEAAKALNGLKTMPAKRLITKHVLRLSKGFGDEKLVDMTDGLKKGEVLSQHWNINPELASNEFLHELSDGTILDESSAYYSSKYGVKVPMKRISFKTDQDSISTAINFLNP